MVKPIFSLNPLDNFLKWIWYLGNVIAFSLFISSSKAKAMYSCPMQWLSASEFLSPNPDLISLNACGPPQLSTRLFLQRSERNRVHGRRSRQWQNWGVQKRATQSAGETTGQHRQLHKATSWKPKSCSASIC